MKNSEELGVRSEELDVLDPLNQIDELDGLDMLGRGRREYSLWVIARSAATWQSH